MRVKGEISHLGGEEEEIRDCEVNMPTCPQQELLLVGYALTMKKRKSFLQPKFERLARNKGILLIAIDLNRPLDDQGPFDVIIHKLRGEEWCEIMEDYRRRHPEVAIIDSPDATRRLNNRQSMLQDVADLNLSDNHGKVGVPKQLVITEDPFSIPGEVARAGLRLPLVVKPLVVDGSAKSHELYLAYDQFSLSELKPPLVLQEFVNHGGLLFKVYIIGDSIKVVRRFSLPNVSKCELAKVDGVYSVPRVSCAAASADDADVDPDIAELPPRPLLEKLSRGLRQRLGLRLFNIDMIREYGTRDVFYVIDINYFPGYGKVPDYEHMFTDFLLTLAPNKQKKEPPAQLVEVSIECT